VGEFERIAEIKRRLLWSGGASSDVALGIGDDAAVLAPSAHAQVWSVDAQVEGVHFRRDLLALPDIGYRAFVAALSDLGAMGARPRAALCSLIVPKALSDAELYAIVDGIAEAQRKYACAVAGGNLAAGNQLSLTTSVLGEASGPLLTRQGARAGDALYVTGELGGAALGLSLLQNGMAERGPRSVARWRRPAARIREGLSIANDASAAIDVSDGLLQDLAHLAGEAEVGFEVELARLPLHPELLALAPALGLHAPTYACCSGEEYELLFTTRPDRAPRSATRIGRVVSGPGIRLLDAAGHEVALPPDRGFDHFRS
jgi:thiamine-monophosphate kinase